MGWVFGTPLISVESERGGSKASALSAASFFGMCANNACLHARILFVCGSLCNGIFPMMPGKTVNDGI